MLYVLINGGEVVRFTVHMWKSVPSLHYVSLKGQAWTHVLKLGSKYLCPLRYLTGHQSLIVRAKMG